MAEYIDREEIKYEQWSVGPLFEPIMVVRKSTVDRIPAADVVPVRHGRNETQMNQVDEFICSECGFTAQDFEGYDSEEEVYYGFNPRYCPNCGAMMDGGEDQ